MKDIHTGDRCFIIGNGPSLTATDLDLLKRNQEISFAFNRVYHIFDQTDWRPTYYMFQDEKMLKGSITDVNRMNVPIKFIPVQNRYYYDIHIDGAIHYKLIHERDDDTRRAFSTDAATGLCTGETVVYCAMQLATYMGFKEIFLLGVDHSFHKSLNNQGEIVIDPDGKDYFCESYNADKDELYIPNTENTTKTYQDAKRYLEELGVKVFNATRGGKLEVFDRVDFDTLFLKHGNYND